MAYDTRCYDLAEVFLEDEPSVKEGDRCELAQHIQTAIEDWLSYRRRNFEPPDPPGWEGGFAENH